ncbi:MAG: CpaF family protein [Elioraea sp.]|nr:CpaF family protein [Elioraea sp.]MDW8444262.1 CpaF family protein [Acetobacteraceae bacterium]
MSGFGRRLDRIGGEAQGAGAAATPAVAAPLPSVLRPGLQPAPHASPRARLWSLVMEQVDPTVAAELPTQRLREEIERLIHQLADKHRIELSAREQAALARDIADDMVGLGPLEPLLADERITDIMVNGPDNIYVEIGGKLEKSSVRFRDDQHAIAVAQKIAAAVGRRVDESSPMVDARLADGSRVNIVLPPLALDGACISIRKFARKRIDFARMVELGSLTENVAKLLEIAARCRLNVLISGGTGSGKTTLLNAMSRMIDHGERIVTIEDAAELQLQQPHVVRLETRPANLEGKGEITQRDLVRNALRMRPDRIILGEVRGPEAFDLLQAMNTGHDGSLGTLHANSARDALIRLENMVQMGNFGLPVRAIRTQIASAVDLIVQVERMRDGTRRVVQIAEVRGIEGDVVTMNDLVAFQYEGEDGRGRIRGRYRTSPIRPGFIARLEYFGLDRAWMAAIEGS